MYSHGDPLVAIPQSASRKEGGSDFDFVGGDDVDCDRTSLLCLLQLRHEGRTNAWIGLKIRRWVNMKVVEGLILRHLTYEYSMIVNYIECIPDIRYLCEWLDTANAEDSPLKQMIGQLSITYWRIYDKQNAYQTQMLFFAELTRAIKEGVYSL